MRNEGAWRNSPGYSPGGIPGENPGETPGEAPRLRPTLSSQNRMPDNLSRMIALVDEVFAMREDPEQLSVDDAVVERLHSIHPRTLSETRNEDGPIAWMLIIPTTTALMERFVRAEITERQLYDMTPEQGPFNCTLHHARSSHPIIVCLDVYGRGEAPRAFGFTDARPSAVGAKETLILDLIVRSSREAPHKGRRAELPGLTHCFLPPFHGILGMYPGFYPGFYPGLCPGLYPG